LKHPYFDGYSHNAAALSLGMVHSNSNNNIVENGSQHIKSGGKIPGSRAHRIDSRKGILSRKSSINKNSFYQQKTKDSLPNKLYGSGNSGGVGSIGSGHRAGYFNKNGVGSSGGLPNLS